MEKKKEHVCSSVCISPITFVLFGLLWFFAGLMAMPPDYEDLEETTIFIDRLASETSVEVGRFSRRNVTRYYLLDTDGIRYSIDGVYDLEELHDGISAARKAEPSADNWFNPDNKSVIIREDTPVTARIWHQSQRIYMLSIGDTDYVTYDPSGVPVITIVMAILSLPFFGLAVVLAVPGGKYEKPSRYSKR